ncbi:MAG: glycosyltransferase family 4 protein [Chitinophagaceae bacterium]|nr:glycosyltransferase family 4 protein [Chitinophagaceae bacterium]
MANILYSAYFCHPEESSESYTAVKWLEILLKQHSVKLLTNRRCATALSRYFTSLPANLEIIGFDIPEWLERRRKVQLYFGYFSFDARSYRYLKKHPALVAWADVILKKTPSSFRYYTSLYKFNKPLVIGPVGGGLQNPKQLKAYFKKEPLINKLRVLDNWLLKIPPFSSQLRYSSQILITLDYLRDILPRSVEHKMTTVLDTGIDVPEGGILHRLKEPGIVQLLYVGKLVKYKGAELLVKSLIPLKGSFKFLLHIIGDGAERENLTRLVHQSGLEEQVKFHGNMEKHEVDTFYQSADIFCFPSLTEASGNVLLEAMLYCLPIITINNGGPKYMCPDAGAVKIAIGSEEKIIQELTYSIAALSENEEKRVQMGIVNYEFVKANFSWSVLEKKINSFFDAYNRGTPQVDYQKEAI